jgi:CheY-like chemotaxis protein
VPTDLPGGDEHILLVDDEPALLDVERMFLEKLGYRVSTAATGEEALEMFRRAPHSFDMVVTDMTMPKMTGEKLAAHLLDARPDLPILLATGYRFQGLGENASEIGFKAFIHKPIIEADLAALIRQVLDEGKAAQ